MRGRKAAVGTVLLVSAVMFAIPSFGFEQSPYLESKVADGELPPVEDRLPSDPFVEAVVDAAGTYGGAFRGFQLGDADKWVLYKTALYGGLISRTYREMGTISKNGMEGWGPAIAESWTWDENAMGLTVKLREGVKWSDGEPLTADDIVWTWNNIQRNQGFQPSVPGQFKVNGEAMEVTKIDDYTVHFGFAGPYPWFLAALYGGTLAPHSPLLAPKHYLEEFHPDENPSMTWQDLQRVYAPANPEMPTASPWMIQKYDPTTEVVLVRNPYYWAVDADGKQLPYIDSMTFTIMGSQEAAVLKGMAGQVDLAERNFQVLQNLPILKQSEETGDYTIGLVTGDNFTNGNEIWFNYDMKDQANPLRELLRDPTFRSALSIAVDRDAINESVYLGLAKPSSIGLSTKSPYWSDKMAEIAQINAEYDPKKASELLDGLGLVDTDGDGFRNYPNGGDNVIIVLGAASEINAHTNFAEMVVNFWQQVGLDARLGVQTRQTLFSGITDGSFNAVVWGTTSVVFPEFRTTEGVISAAFQSSPAQVANPPEDLKQLWDIRDQILLSTDPDHTQELMEEGQRLRAANAIGIFSANDVPLVVIKSNRLKNVPQGDSVVIDEQDHLTLIPHQWYIEQ